jgi:hypothetical protein
VSAEAVLCREQLWGIVSGRNPRRSLDQNDNEKLEEWDDSDDKAIGTLILSMIPTTTALWTNPKGKSSGPQAGRTGNQTECYYCRKKGHFKRECRKLKADFAAGRVGKDGKSNLGSGSAEANTASTVDAFNMITSEGANNVIDTHLARTPMDTFYIDTGASRHISPRKEWFRNLETSLRSSFDLVEN